MNNSDTSPYTNSLFEQPWWLDAVAPNQWHEITLTDKEEIIARWVYTTCKGQISMPPFTQTLGFWISDTVMQQEHQFHKQKEIITQLINHLPAVNIKTALDPANHYFLPFLWNRFTIRPYITYRIHNLNDLDNVYHNFSKVAQKNIRSASHKVTIQAIDDISLLYRLLVKTFALQKRACPFSETCLKRLYEAAKMHQAAKLLFAIDEAQNVHSGVLYVYDERTCYYLVSGTDPQFRSVGSNSLLIWEGIQWAAKNSKVFDFEGSVIEGIENFVRQFGGFPTVYYEVRRLSLWKEIMEICKPAIKRLIGYKQ